MSGRACLADPDHNRLQPRWAAPADAEGCRAAADLRRRRRQGGRRPDPSGIVWPRRNGPVHVDVEVLARIGSPVQTRDRPPVALKLGASHPGQKRPPEANPLPEGTSASPDDALSPPARSLGPPPAPGFPGKTRKPAAWLSTQSEACARSLSSSPSASAAPSDTGTAAVVAPCLIARAANMPESRTRPAAGRATGLEDLPPDAPRLPAKRPSAPCRDNGRLHRGPSSMTQSPRPRAGVAAVTGLGPPSPAGLLRWRPCSSRHPAASQRHGVRIRARHRACYPSWASGTCCCLPDRTGGSSLETRP